MRSYYPDTAKKINQMRGYFLRPSLGMNSYTPAGSIDDSVMSDLLDVMPYRDEAIEFLSIRTAQSELDVEGANQGRVVAAFEVDATDKVLADHAFVGMTIRTDKWRLFYASVPFAGANTYTAFDMTVPSVPNYTTASALYYSSALFRTRESVFYCFAASNLARLHYIKVDYNGGSPSYGYVDLPSIPKSMVAHANRIFMIDTGNKLWWCRGGDIFSWYSLEYDNSRLMAESNMANKAHTLTGEIDIPRVVTATCTSVGASDTRGKLVITGTNALGKSQTATINLTADGTHQTSEIFATVASATQSGWTANGTADKISIGVGPTGGYVVDDAGYWTIDTEYSLHDLFVLGDVLYISAGSSLYAFRGYDYQTFALQKTYSNLGNPAKQVFGYHSVVVVRNMAYFKSGTDIFEFNGDSPPSVISRPVHDMSGLTNNMFGGVSFTKHQLSKNWVLAADEDKLYVYYANNAVSQEDVPYYYIYHFETRTWWRHSAWDGKNAIANAFMRYRFVPRYDNKSFIPFFWINRDGLEDSWWIDISKSSVGVSLEYENPFVITKAYQGLASETGTLTAIILSLKGVEKEVATIEVQYSLTEDEDDFRTIRRYRGYQFTGDKERIHIPMPVAFIANAPHYRVKVIVSDQDESPVWLYNVERRYRVRGYSR